MKIFWMRIKMFFSLPSTKTFLKVFAVSFPIVCVLMYFFVLKLLDMVDDRDMQDRLSNFYEIVDMGIQRDDYIIVDYSAPEQRSVINFSNSNFWEGSALEYRYIMPEHKIPAASGQN